MPINYGLRVRTIETTTIIGLGANISNLLSGNGGIDLSYGGTSTIPSAAGAAGLTLIGCLAGAAGWMMPANFTIKPATQFINCDQPTGSTNDVTGTASGMYFFDLPGQGGPMTTPIEGMTYDIIDATWSGTPTLTLGATVSGGGSGSAAHRRIRYNAAAAAWQVIG
jgi:hypothetical protein